MRRREIGIGWVVLALLLALVGHFAFAAMMAAR